MLRLDSEKFGRALGRYRSRPIPVERRSHEDRLKRSSTCARSPLCPCCRKSFPGGRRHLPPLSLFVLLLLELIRGACSMLRQKTEQLNLGHASDRGKKRRRSVSPTWLWLRVTYHTSRESAGRGGTVGGWLDALNTYDLEYINVCASRQMKMDADMCNILSQRVRARPQFKSSRSSSGDSSSDQPKQHQQQASSNRNRHPK